MTWNPIIPAPAVLIIGLVIIALTVAGYLRVGKHLHWFKRLFLLLCRIAGICCLLLLLLQPSKPVAQKQPQRQNLLLVGLDTSKSMNQKDAGQARRLDAAKAVLGSALQPTAEVAWKYYHFDSVVTPVSNLEGLQAATAAGENTLIHDAVTKMIDNNANEQSEGALILLSDGHDFGATLPNKTAFHAKSKRFSIYAVPFGKAGSGRDVAVEVTSFQPYAYVGQKAVISANLRFTGAEYEDLQVQLLKGDRVVDSRKLNTDDVRDRSLSFEITEPNTGQFEYEVRVLPLPGEAETGNNSSTTYLNIIEEQLRVLLLEGSPNWESAFLQRALLRNDKCDLDIITQYAPKRARRIRKNPSLGELKLPEKPEDFFLYDVVIVGRSVEQVLSKAQQIALKNFVWNHGGSVIFLQGADVPEIAKEWQEMQPLVWAQEAKTKVKLEVAPDGLRVSPLEILTADKAAFANLPELFGARITKETKPLTAVFAQARDTTGAGVPGIVHRRFGRGQVLSFNLEGFWRIGFHSKSDPSNKLYDRFWDQMLIWLAATSDFNPNIPYTFRASSSSISLGDPINFSLQIRNPKDALPQVGLEIYREEKLMARTALVPGADGDRTRLTCAFIPPSEGRYEARPLLQGLGSVKFRVAKISNEETDVSADLRYLSDLCEGSGGRIIQPKEVPELVKSLTAPKEVVPDRVKLEPIWGTVWFFYLIGFLFGIDWFCRRKWGLT